MTWRRAAACGFAAVGLCLILASAAQAQTSRVAFDVVAAVDGVKGSTPRREAGVWFDLFGAVRISDGLDIVARPILSRRPFDGVWQKQIYQLGLRYERPSATPAGIGFGLEAGQMPSPIGIAMLENRSDLNPLVSQHSAYYLPIPRNIAIDLPRVFLIAGTYPLGAQATVSSRVWDARVAIVDSSPIRGRGFFGANKPPRLANLVLGAGVTPRVGLRLGAAFAHGAWAAASEMPDPSRGDRMATMMQVEAEWSFGYTKITGELIRSAFETPRADSLIRGGWIEATQTLAPRLFVAGRFDSQQVDYQRAGFETFMTQHYERVEAIAGFRITPDLTLRGGYMVRKGYVVSHWDDQVIGSVVFQRKFF